MASGYPTPNVQIGDVTFGCISVFVPNNPEFEGIFAAAIYGLYASMSNEWFWRNQGTMTPADAAFLAARGLAESGAYEGLCGGDIIEMSCEDMANCIETDEAVQTAIETSVTNNGFQRDSETAEVAPPPSVTASAKALDLLADGTDCENYPQMMGLARAIVKELHETAEDFFETLEYATNLAESAAIAADAIPFAKPAATFLDFVDWVLATMREAYQAAYNQQAEDDLACAIFCHIVDNCTLSLADLSTIYETAGTISVPPLDDLDAVLGFALEYDFSVVDTTTVAIFHYQILRLLGWGSFAGFSYQYLKMLIQSNVSSYDHSYDDLCDCTEPDEPTAYWRLYYDFRVSQYGTETTTVLGNGNDGRWVGNGYQYNAVDGVTTLNVNFGVPDLGAAYVIKAMASRSVRRGSDGNGSNDTVAQSTWSGANYTGTPSNFGNTGFISENSNEVTVGAISGVAVFAVRSFKHIARVSQPVSVQPAMLRVYEFVVWGEAGVGDTKPERAEWVGNTLPTLVPDLFPT